MAETMLLSRLWAEHKGVAATDPGPTMVCRDIYAAVQLAMQLDGQYTNYQPCSLQQQLVGGMVNCPTVVLSH